MKSQKSSKARLELCSYCLKREGLSNRKGQKLASKAADFSNCQICGGRLAGLRKVAGEVARKLSEYQFETFLVGTTLPQSLLDREDEIRSSLRIRGREGIKTQITRTIGKYVSGITGKNADYSRPDVTILVSLDDQVINVFPKSIWLFARYLKKERGIPQKSSTCIVCNGLGCASCDFKGVSSSSIQSIVSAFLTNVFFAESCNFIWLGGEDENSLVLGNGRPFFAEIVHPKRRSMRTDWNSKGAQKSHKETKTKKMKAKEGQTIHPVDIQIQQPMSEKVEITAIQILHSKPTQIPMFKIECAAHLVRQHSSGEEAQTDQTGIQMPELEKRFTNRQVSVQVSRKFKRVQKQIDRVRVSFESGDDNPKGRATLRIECDGGIPIKKLVLAEDDSVSPNFAPYVKGFTLDHTRPFDILDVHLIPPQGSSDGLSRKGTVRTAFSRTRNTDLGTAPSIEEQPGNIAVANAS